MKKLEFVFLKSVMEELFELLKTTGITGYTVLEIYKGYGPQHGDSLDLGFSSGHDCLYMFSVCDKRNYENFKNNALAKVKSLGVYVASSDIFIE